MKPPLFHVGQAVVCVIAEGCALLNKGAIYNVVGLPFSKALGRQVLELAEFPPFCGLPHMWVPERFAPVEEMPAEAYAELLEALEPVTT